MRYIRSLPVRVLALFARLHDLSAIVLTWLLAYWVRFNFEVPPPDHLLVMWKVLPFVVSVELISFSFFGLYRGVWRFASLPDLRRILNAVVSSALLISAAAFMLRDYLVVPRTVLVIAPCLLILFLGGSRFLYRYLKDYRHYRISSRHADPVIVIGTGEAAISLLKEIGCSEHWQIAALLDDDASLDGREILGVRVYGKLDQLGALAASLAVSQVIIALPSATQAKRRHIIEVSRELGLAVLTVPSIDDLISGRLSVSQLRPVDVEDLLGRDAVDLDQTGLRELISGHVVMVTGAGGSIGSELCRQIVKYSPSLLICYDLSELALYQLEQELKRMAVNFVSIVGDIKNTQRLEMLLTKYAPKVVFHAAAYKHVPLMETDNVSEALLNNVLGTYTLARACQQMGVPKFVLVSTDKAVNPTNVMGASKRLAEMVIQGLQDQFGTRFVMVRFGNVLGSSGSVVPKFREQIAAGGPITITHPEITRYFMSIPEAAQLVMQAGLMGAGGEIFVLDMGEPVRIVDLANDMIKLSGFKVGEIAIEFVGLRPGEKLFEELLADDENTKPTPHHKLRIANARVVDVKWVKDLMEWISCTPLKSENLIKSELKAWVPDYTQDIRDNQ
jgi:FlaA1/EpsC-like NDP-sugar epimerase